jgi:hypothetical protein
MKGAGVALPMDTARIGPSPTIYWHRELPPLEAQTAGEHVVEASSTRMPDTIANRNDLWNRCERELMDNARERIRQEIARLGGRYAHVFDESIEPRHDARTGEAWLYGRFIYTLYR